jgi:hypothetical protein
MSWHIVSMQKPIPRLNNWAHNYVALVDDNGNIVAQFHGNWSKDPVQIFSVDPNNPLAVQSYDPLDGVKNNPIETQNAVPVKLPDGKVANGIAVDAVPPGDEQKMRAMWNSGTQAVSDTLKGDKFLYKTATGLGFGGEAINSNSVWFTFLKAIGVEHPDALNGPGAIPGSDVDLRTHKTNNPLYKSPAEPDDRPSQPGKRGSAGGTFYGDLGPYGAPPFDPSVRPPLQGRGSQGSDTANAPVNAASLRSSLEQRAATLGITHAAYMPTDALLAEIHGREGDATQAQDADATADRIEHEMDVIGAPLVAQPGAADPPPLGSAPLTRASIDQRAARFGLRFGPAVPDDRVLAAVHKHEGDAAPPAAAAALADRIEREIDGTVSAAGVPWGGGDDDVANESQA